MADEEDNSDHKFVSRYSAIGEPLCLSCRWYDHVAHFRCTAYPEGIPNDITAGRHDHHEPYPGDHGVRYEKKV